MSGEACLSPDMVYVKNLLTVFSSMGGRLEGTGGELGSTWPAAAKEEISDKHAEEARSN